MPITFRRGVFTVMLLAFLMSIWTPVAYSQQPTQPPLPDVDATEADLLEFFSQMKAWRDYMLAQPPGRSFADTKLLYQVFESQCQAIVANANTILESIQQAFDNEIPNDGVFPAWSDRSPLVAACPPKVE